MRVEDRLLRTETKLNNLIGASKRALEGLKRCYDQLGAQQAMPDDSNDQYYELIIYDLERLLDAIEYTK